VTHFQNVGRLKCSFSGIMFIYPAKSETYRLPHVNFTIIRIQYNLVNRDGWRNVNNSSSPSQVLIQDSQID